MKYLLTLLLIVGIRVATFAQQSNELHQLADYMTGTYTNHEQHLADSSNFYEIKLQIIPIWQNRKDGYWFYVEQAVVGALDKPYRQRVYHLTEKEKGVYCSEVFTMNNPLRFAGKAALCASTLTPDSLTVREGCAVLIRKKDVRTFEGSTEGSKCASDRQGAVYATSEVVIGKATLSSWDRGYDADNKQVWGAKKGPYVFVKTWN